MPNPHLRKNIVITCIDACIYMYLDLIHVNIFASQIAMNDLTDRVFIKN